jgi:hypothetical protein
MRKKQMLALLIPLLIPLLILLGWAQGLVFGSWKLNTARSTFSGETPPKSLTLRVEPHAKGEVVTIDRAEANGRATSSSMILYLDGVARPFQDVGCSGTRSSRRIDTQTVEILRTCTSGESTKFLRRLARPGAELILEITEQRPGGRRFERRLVLQKQPVEED